MFQLTEGKHYEYDSFVTAGRTQEGQVCSSRQRKVCLLQKILLFSNQELEAKIWMYVNDPVQDIISRWGKDYCKKKSRAAAFEDQFCPQPESPE